MPRDGSGHFFVPVGTDGVADQTIDSGRYNAYVHDVELDLNTPRPVTAGGTGADNAIEALHNLNGEMTRQVVDNYDMFTFASGSFYSGTGATHGPVDGHGFAGICYVYDPGGQNYITLEARDLNDSSTYPPRKYIRTKLGGVWGAWAWDQQIAADLANTKVDKGGDVMIGPLVMDAADPVILLNSAPGAHASQIVFRKGGANDVTKNRWNVNCDNEAETGGSAGSNFVIQGYADGGAPLAIALEIERVGGRLIGSGAAPVNGVDLANKAYVDAAASSASAALAGKVAKTGDVMSGPLTTTALTSTGAVTAAATVQGATLTSTGTIGAAGTIQAAGGTYYFQDTGKYIVNDGTNFHMVGGGFDAPGLTSNNSLVISKATSAANDVYFVLQNHLGVNQGYVTWNSTDASLALHNSTAGNGLYVLATGVIRTSLGLLGRKGKNTPGTSDVNCHNFYWNGSTNEMWLDDTNLGNVAVTCDYRVKKDVAPLASTWEVVRALNPISYTQAEFTSPSTRVMRAADTAKVMKATPQAEIPAWPPTFVADDVPRWGFIAHELQETLLPSAATGEKDAPDLIQSPNLLPVIAALTKALQEAMARIEALEARTGATYATSR